MSSLAYTNTRVVRSGWLEEGGRRLDCNPYMSGALEARDTLRELKARKEPLKSLTAGYAGGIYNGPMFRRNYVDSPEHGVPFISSGTMLLADLGVLPLLRRKDAESARLSYLRLKPGMTMISCSGTIGRMCYVRPGMDGVWSSQDVLKVVADPNRIQPGYLYAFLSSRYGVPLIVSGTYGAIIQHIEPEHIADLPVPRLEEDLERKAARLVVDAGARRTLASAKRKEAIALFERAIGWDGLGANSISGAVMASALSLRMDAFHHSAKVATGRRFLASKRHVRLGGYVESVFEPNRGSRLKVTDPAFGVPFLSSSAVFEVAPSAEYLVSRLMTPHIESLLLTDRDVLLPRSGQVGGIIGRAVLPLPRNIGNAGSEHLVRVRCRSASDAAYLWAVLASEPGYWAAVGTAFGSSIPSLDAGLIAELRVPWLRESDRQAIGNLVNEATLAQDEGIALETRAVAMLEQRIAGSSQWPR